MSNQLRETMLDAKGVADLLGYTVQHTRWLFRHGIMPALKLGRDWFILREDLEPYIAQRASAVCARQGVMPLGDDNRDQRFVKRTGRVDSTRDESVAVSAVNVSQVPQLSPFRYPGGKTWLIPYIRKWLSRYGGPSTGLVEPFAGGGIVSLTGVFEGLVKDATLVELDEDIAAVWETILNGHGPWLAEAITRFKPTAESVRRVIARAEESLERRAFASIVRNRVMRGGILAPGAGFVKRGENGKGLSSRWYPQTLRRRILQIVEHSDRIRFTAGDGLKVLRSLQGRTDVVFFIDPPYTVAGRRLYKYFEVDHNDLFAIASRLKGNFLMTYDSADEIRSLADEHGFDRRAIEMKTTHHRQKTELLIGRDLDWLER